MPRAWVQFLVGELDPTSRMAQPKHKNKPTNSLVPELGGQARPADQTAWKAGPSWGQPHSGWSQVLAEATPGTGGYSESGWRVGVDVLE